MDNAAFARAVRFLNYSPVAKWLAIVGGVGSAILYVCLLLVLGLFADLLVNRGEIPAFHNLSSRERIRFLESVAIADDAETRKQQIDSFQQHVKELGISEPAWLKLVASEPKVDNKRDQEMRGHLLWFAEQPGRLDESVGTDAGNKVREQIKEAIANLGVEPAVHTSLKDLGILSLVVRSEDSLLGQLNAALARYNDWTWYEGNNSYLVGLFLWALVIALIRLCLKFVSSFLAARATIEAVLRLRKAVYQQTYRLGTLAFRALGPSEAVSVSTRHLESVHTGLHSYLTDYFCEPVKFFLLLFFAMLVNFWLALAFLLFAVLVWVVGGQIAAYFRRRGRAAETQAADQLALIQESLMLLRLVKIYLMETFNQARFDKQNAKYAEAQLERYRGEAIYRPVFLFLGLFAVLILLLLSGFVILRGYLGVASAIVMVTALVSLYWPMASWLDKRRMLRKSRESARVLFAFLDRTGSV
jgi:ATP-binding cassette subfamily B protein